MHLIFHDNLFDPNRLVFKRPVTTEQALRNPSAYLTGYVEKPKKPDEKKEGKPEEELEKKAKNLEKEKKELEKKADKKSKERRKGLKKHVESGPYLNKVRDLLKENPELFRQYVMSHRPHTYKKGDWKKSWNPDLGKVIGVNKEHGKYARALQKILKHEEGLKLGIDGQMGRGTVRALARYLRMGLEKGEEGEEAPPPFEFTPEQWEFIKPYYWPYVTMLDVTRGLDELNIPKATSQRFAKAFYACMEAARDAGLMHFRPNNVHSWQNVFEHLMSNNLVTEGYLNIVYPSILETFTQEEYKKELEYYETEVKKQKEEGGKTEGETGKEINVSSDDKAGSKKAIEEKDAGVEGDLSISPKNDLFKESKMGFATLKDRLLMACRTASKEGSDIEYDMFEQLPQGGHVRGKYNSYKGLNKKWKEKWTEYKKVKEKLGTVKRLVFNKDIKDARKERDKKIDEMYQLIEERFNTHDERIERFTNSHDLPSEFVPQAAYDSKDILEKKIPTGVSVNGVLKLLTNKNRKRIFKNFGELVEGTYKEATDLFAVSKLAKDSPKKLLNAINAAILIKNIDKYINKIGGINIFN